MNAQRINSPSRKQPQRHPADKRRGAVAVEFAVVAPVLVAIVLGMIELTRLFEIQNLLAVGAREGARFASIDRDEAFLGGMSTTDKLKNDVKNLLASNGIPRDEVTVLVKDHENPDADFDMDASANYLKLFDVRVSVDYSSVSYIPVPAEQDRTLTATVTFRNGRGASAE